MEYVTRYPKTVSLGDGEDNKIHVDKKTGVEELHLIVKESAEKMRKILFNEGFTTVKFEHKQPLQIGDGLSLKLKKPWEMHVRLFSNTKNSISIQGEVDAKINLATLCLIDKSIISFVAIVFILLVKEIL